jgi:hypothetical protein
MTRTSPTRHLSDEKGQSALLVAMLFNVLFVFFAMAINVALVVHDKINLQNSADLAAYYAAEKQAEILNTIAHENYMIRQSWKLLAWRYRVLGTIGMIDSSSVHPTHSGNISDSVWQPAVRPAVCMTYQPNWFEVPAGEDLCRRPDVNIPPLPQVKVIFTGLALNAGIAALSTQLILQFNAQCQKHGAYNWWFANNIMHAFQLDQRNRMQVIQALAANLSNGKNGDFLDLDGNSVLAGAQKTFQKNLTFGNSGTMQNFTLVNGLEGVPVDKWLPKVLIAPTIEYADVDNSNGCVTVNAFGNVLPREQGGKDVLNTPLPSGLGAADLYPFSDMLGNPNPASDWQYTLGVEKNPWYMAYTGAKATTQPREIFFPMAGAVPMTARAYAKPFGGRIGPWYADHWDSGSPTSTGNPIDALAPPRMDSSGGVDSSDPRRLPNYARYPGDQLGLMAALSQNSITNLGSFQSKFAYYMNIKADFQPGADNDIMPWDGGAAPPIRYIELAAIAPDLFDITYYSIEADFERNYLARLRSSATALGIPSTTPLRGDLGYNGTAIPAYSIQDQFTDVTTKGLQRTEAYYFVRDKFNLLTAWLPAQGAFSYDVTEALKSFGKCQKPDDTYSHFNPGSCVAGGGRTGYSTKMVSRDLLMNAQQPLGGSSGSGGVISNPPTD